MITVRTTGMTDPELEIKTPVSEDERQLMGLRGQQVPERPGFYFGDKLYLSSGGYLIEVIKRND